MREYAFWFMASMSALAIAANAANLLHRGVYAYSDAKARKRRL